VDENLVLRITIEEESFSNEVLEEWAKILRIINKRNKKWLWIVCIGSSSMKQSEKEWNGERTLKNKEHVNEKTIVGCYIEVGEEELVAFVVPFLQWYKTNERDSVDILSSHLFLYVTTLVKWKTPI
jgi:hypothetical protein